MEMSRDEEVKMKNKSISSSLRCLELVLRTMILVLTLVSAILMGTEKQTKIVSLSLVPTLPPLKVQVTAKWHYMLALVYFVVANGIACTHVAFSLVLTLASKGKSKASTVIIALLDLMVVPLLFSANGATLAVGLLGYKGNSHLQWNKVCDVFGTFCHHVVASVTLSMLASVGLLGLTVVHVYNLHNKTA